MKQVQSRPKTELVSATSAIEAQYSRADLRARITDALQAAGKDLDRLSINDLALMDEFHLCGRAATTDLADLAAIQAEDHLLDIGAVLVTDDEIRRAVLEMIKGTRNLAEPAGAAPLAAAIKLRNWLAGKRVALICSGGNISLPQLGELITGVTARTLNTSQISEADMTENVG